MCFPSYNSSIYPTQYTPLTCELFREHTILTFSFIKKMSHYTTISYLIFFSIFSNEKHAIQHTYLLSRSKSSSRASKSKEKSSNLHIDIVVLSNFAVKSNFVASFLVPYVKYDGYIRVSSGCLKFNPKAE